MAENTTPAMCSEAVYQAARAAGVLIVTTGEEAAIQKFAEAMYRLGYSDGTDSIATGEAPNEREVFLPAAREETVYEKSARWAWPDGRPDL
jgi:hypothetical protein